MGRGHSNSPMTEWRRRYELPAKLPPRRREWQAESAGTDRVQDTIADPMRDIVALTRGVIANRSDVPSWLRDDQRGRHVIHGLDLDDTTRAPLARLNSSGLVINVGQTHKVWRGLVQVERCMEPAIPVALKWMPGSHKLPIELACALAAAEIGLPVPRGVLVLAKRDQLPGLVAAAKPLPGSDDFLCYGSAHQFPDDSRAQHLDGPGTEEFTWKDLCDHPVAAPGAAWDELADNADRHIGNLLFDGSKYWFIDHELALPPIAKVMRNLVQQRDRLQVVEHRARVNLVAEQLQRRRPNDHGMLAQPPRFARIEGRLKVLADRVRLWQTGHAQVDHVWPLTEIVLRGIASRLPALALMLTERLDIPSANSLWNSSSPASQ